MRSTLIKYLVFKLQKTYLPLVRVCCWCWCRMARWWRSLLLGWGWEWGSGWGWGCGCGRWWGCGGGVGDNSTIWWCDNLRLLRLGLSLCWQSVIVGIFSLIRTVYSMQTLTRTLYKILHGVLFLSVRYILCLRLIELKHIKKTIFFSCSR